MTKHEKFNFHDKIALQEKAEALGLDIPFSDDIDILFNSFEIAGNKLQNRFVVQPMEGFDAEPGGTPGELTLRRYQRFAAGGSALIWFEATAVISQGLSNPRQLMITRKNIDGFKRLVEITHNAAHKSIGISHDPVLILQITHSGRFSRPLGKPEPVIAFHNDVLDPIHEIYQSYPVVSDEELDRLQDSFVSAAKLAEEAGFDGVDIKACHGYLVSELLSAFLRRNSRYGASLENRSRFLLETAQKIRSAVSDLFLACRFGAFDGIPHPFGFGVDREDCTREDLTETKALIRELIASGLSILNISVGNPYINPHYVRPFDSHVTGGEVPDEHPMAGVARLLRITGEIQQTFTDLPVVGTGYSWLRQFFPNVGAAVVKSGKATLIGQGRGAFAYPDSVKDLADRGFMDPLRVCITCSGCTQHMRDGKPAGCVVRDHEIYGINRTSKI
jgi:2,4-dienoyl-CoA reductase-like NADH-dependent reductase (Old Yellow Enzyme family)